MNMNTNIVKKVNFNMTTSVKDDNLVKTISSIELHRNLGLPNNHSKWADSRLVISTRFKENSHYFRDENIDGGYQIILNTARAIANIEVVDQKVRDAVMLGIERHMDKKDIDDANPFANKPKIEGFNTSTSNKPYNLDWIFEGHEVRINTDSNGEPWFVVKDICDILGIKDASQSVKNFSPKMKGTCKTRTNKGIHKLQCVNEPGLYKLVTRSNKPEADRFSNWIYSTVLPSIRKTGGYSVNRPTPKIPADFADALQLAADQQREIQANAPKVNMYDTVLGSKGAITMQQMSHMLGVKLGGKYIGRNNLMKLLRADNWLSSSDEYKNKPYSTYIDDGYLTYGTKRVADGSIAYVPFVTPKGIKKIYGLISSRLPSNHKFNSIHPPVPTQYQIDMDIDSPEEDDSDLSAIVKSVIIVNKDD